MRQAQPKRKPRMESLHARKLHAAKSFRFFHEAFDADILDLESFHDGHSAMIYMNLRLHPAFCALALLAAPWLAAAQGTNVTTYHYDNLRTGWNQNETVLTPASVGGSGFGLQAQVALDEQVDAQPLFASAQHIAGGTHDVVYVATENDTLYAIDANSGQVLLSQNYGIPVPASALPGGCNNNSNNLGINSTPAFDATTNTIYAITYTYENGVPTFRLHAVDAGTLADKMPNVAIGGSAALRSGRPEAFVSANNRQRNGLLEANGNVYAGFASWCDINANVARGWVMGWNASTLAPLPLSELTNRRSRSADSFFLSSIWMSGYGMAADATGNLFFVTGNSDYNAKSYSSTYNLSESVVKLSADLSTVESFFTPAGGPNGWQNLDRNDVDFGSGGVLLLPDQPGTYPHLAVAAGKGGPMYLLNRDTLGGLGGPKHALGAYNNNGCWCGPAYFVGADGGPRVVESSGHSLDVWKVQTAPTTSLVYDTGTTLTNGQDPGFFTTISSNGTTPGTAVIWAVGRPVNTNPANVTLYAFDPANAAATLFSAVAGTWPFAGSANANLVPVVANGHVFVASYANLSIFGLGASDRSRHFVAPPRPDMPRLAGSPHAVTGTVVAMAGDTITLQRRDGTRMSADVAASRAASRYAPMAEGRASLVRGDWRHGVLIAHDVLHAKPNPAMWAPDY